MSAAQSARPPLRKTHADFPQGDWFRDPRADCRGAFRVPFPEQIDRLSAPLADAFRDEIADSRLSAGGQRLLRAVLEHTDYKTRICSRRRAYLLKQADVSERWATMLITACVAADVLARIEFEAKHENLRPPLPNQLKGTEEWELGCWVLRWEALTPRQFREGIRKVPAIVRGLKRASGQDLSDVQGVDPGIGPRSIPRSAPGRSRDRPPADLKIDPSIAPQGFLDLDPSLSFDRLPLPSIIPPTSALSPPEGDPRASPIASSEEPGSRCTHSASPSAAGPLREAARPRETHLAPLLASAPPREGFGGRESANADSDLPEASAIESGTCRVPDANGVRGATSADGEASARRMPEEVGKRMPTRFAPEARQAIAALMGRCRAFTEAAKLPGKFDSAALFPWCVAQYTQHGLSLEWLEAWGVGVARGGGEARDGRANAKAQGVNVFHYATGNPEVYVQEGRRVLAAERYAREPEPPEPPPPATSTRTRTLTREQLAFLAELDEEAALRVINAIDPETKKP